MPRLFLVYLGGGTPKSNIELHDVQFVAGETIEDTFEQLRGGRDSREQLRSRANYGGRARALVRDQQS